MEKKRTIIIGDIHGCLPELQRLLKKIDFNKNIDRCISVGDLLDRGPASADTVQFMIENDIEMVLGNHDEKYLKYWQNQKKHKQFKGANPFKKNLDKAKIWDSLSEEHFEWLNKQPYYIEIPEYNVGIVHAGVLPARALDKQDKETLLYLRFVEAKSYKKLHLGPNFTQPKGSVHWTEVYNGTMDIIYGHTVHSIEHPLIKTNVNGGRTIGIDTGACFGGFLTAVILSEENPKGVFVQEKSNFSFKIYKIAD